MSNFNELENLDSINGGGLIGAAGGALLGATYGMAAGALVTAKTGNIKDTFKTAWASSMLWGGVGAVLPEP
ncbi:hypothetical protein ACOT7R_17585 [Clostridium perfringens]|uniref:hypothetical protein n=1 Tax=Clostridium perfringens TaxID=1502 RepID=UPI001DB5AE0F|nr:hypothetical protein [Clostridium perfringens]